MKNELKKLTEKQLIELIKTFEHYPAVTLKDGKDYILSYLEDEACTISKKEISEYLLKNGVEINQENIHLYYQYMNEDELFKNQKLINNTLRYRYNEYIENNIGMIDYPNLMSYYINFDFEITSLLKEGWGNTMIVINEIFGIKDILKPVNEYIKEIKETEQYKIFTSECRCNNCMTYFESDDDLIDGEDEDGAFKGCPKCNTDKYLMNLANLK